MISSYAPKTTPTVSAVNLSKANQLQVVSNGGQSSSFPLSDSNAFQL